MAFPLIGEIGVGQAWLNDLNASWCTPEMVTSNEVLFAQPNDLSGFLRASGIQKPWGHWIKSHPVTRTCGVSISAVQAISESCKATEFALFETQGRGIIVARRTRFHNRHAENEGESAITCHRCFLALSKRSSAPNVGREGGEAIGNGREDR